MTRQRLYNLKYLAREIEIKERQLEQLQEQVYSIPGPNLTGMPKSFGSTGSRAEQLACDITDLQCTLLDIKSSYVRERIEIERWISSIPNCLTRLVITFYFIERMEWSEVAYAIGGYTESGIKSICYRYLDANTENNPDIDDTESKIENM